jgi:hypothetical protein
MVYRSKIGIWIDDILADLGKVEIIEICSKILDGLRRWYWGYRSLSGIWNVLNWWFLFDGFTIPDSIVCEPIVTVFKVLLLFLIIDQYHKDSSSQTESQTNTC